MPNACLTHRQRRKYGRLLVLTLIIISVLSQTGLFAMPDTLIQAETETPINRTGVVTVSTVANVRTVPTTIGNVPIDQAPNGQAVFVVSSVIGENVTNYGNLWYKIQYTNNQGNYIEGYTVAGFISLDPPDPEDDPAFEALLDQENFPESYRPGLRRLHAKYPNWIFKSVETRLKFWDAVEIMHQPGYTLMSNTENDAWKSLDPKAYNWYTNKWTVFDGSSWIMCSRDLIAYYMDPRNMFDEKKVFQFEILNYQPEVHHKAGVEAILRNTFMDGKSFEYFDSVTKQNVTMTYAEAFMQAAVYSNVNPYHLASRSVIELGNNSPSVSGVFSEALAAAGLTVTTDYDGYYNFYNIGASADPYPINIQNGLEIARYGNDRKEEETQADRDMLIPWNNRYRAIAGGAYDIGIRYINASLNIIEGKSTRYADQNTIFLQKYNIAYVDSVDFVRRYWHLYMGSIYAPPVEGAKLYNGYASMGDLQKPITFLIPLYAEMPDQMPLPAKTGNPNNWLKSLSVDGYSITPTFDAAVTETYSLIVDYPVSQINVKATVIAGTSKIAGVGSIQLKVGSNSIPIVVTAENGSQRTYSLVVVRRSDPNNPQPTPGPTPEPTPTVPPLEERISSQSLIIEGTTVSGLDPTTGDNTIENIKRSISIPEGYSIRMVKPNGELATDPIGTGHRIEVILDADGSVQKSYDIVIFGDINGDGKISSSDMNSIFRHILRRESVEGIHSLAADIDHNEKISSSDMNLIFQHILRRQSIKQK